MTDRLAEIAREVIESGKPRVVSGCFMSQAVREVHGNPRFFAVVPGWMHDSILTEGALSTETVVIYAEGTDAYRKAVGV